MNTEETFELDVLDLSTSELKQYKIVDIREPGEDPSHILKSLLGPNVQELPMSTIEEKLDLIDRDSDYLFVCQRGRRSARLVELLREKGFTRVFSLKDGVEAVRRKFIA